jgi:predicted metal-dependent peptidase
VQDESDAEWKRVAERMQEELETFSKNRGDRAGHLMQNLRELTRERYDYTAFLRKFAVPVEVMRVNDDEFDYLYYTYGMTRYARMPLIEPLEYRDEKRIKEFVIAIDTSGSVSGELVQTFVQKTYNVLKSTESFSTKINLHVIQCDAAIQEDVRITSQEEFDAYLARMRIRGLGGTDFRPVFDHVNRLCEKKEFTNLKGLIYFTDGYGIFPSQMPPYPTAFIFIDDALNNPDVPPWAIKLVLRKDEV